MVNDVSTQTEPHEPAAAAQPLVRVIDDDDTVRRSWQFVLEGEGWSVCAYESAVRFLAEDDPSVPGCIVSDVRMPEMSGIELQAELKKRGNAMPLVLISAHADLVMAVKVVREKDVARGVAEGKLNKQIAFDLNISEKTVIAHRSALCRKLGIRTGADITRMLLVVEREEKAQGKKA